MHWCAALPQSMVNVNGKTATCMLAFCLMPWLQQRNASLPANGLVTVHFAPALMHKRRQASTSIIIQCQKHCSIRKACEKSTRALTDRYSGWQSDPVAPVVGAH